MSNRLNLLTLFAISALVLAPLAKAQTTVTVPADKLWTDTGISLLAGETVSVTASGTVYTGGNIPGWAYNTPDGAPLPQCAIGRTSVFPAPGLPCFSLMGRITQTGTPFEVGSSVTFAAATGEFYLGVNDNYIPDNLDDWTAVVTVYPASQLVLGCQPLPSLSTLTAGVPYTATCTAYGGTPPYSWAPPAGLPNGLTQTPVNNTSVTIGGTPAGGGAYNYTVGVSDISTPVQSQTLNYQGTIGTLSISCTTTTGVPIPGYPNTGPAQVNVPYSATCTASGGTPQYTWSFVGGTPPADVSLSSTTGASVTISGSPTAAAGYSYTVQVQDDSSPAQKASVSYDGDVGDLSITCTTASGPAQVGVSYSATCTAANSAEDYNSYNWSIAPGGSLPLGLSLNPPTNGASVTISGIPTAAGQYNYTVQVTDSDNPTEIVAQNYSGSISAPMLSASPPPPLNFNYQVGGMQPGCQTISLTSSGTALAFSAAASTSSGGNWLTVNPASGTTPATLTVCVITSGLAAGAYNGSVTVTAAGAGNSPLAMAVVLTVTQPMSGVTVMVPANTLWTDTGISLLAGETVSVTASGTVYTGGNIPGWAYNTPNGAPLPQCAIGRTSVFPAPGLPCFSLMGKITQTGTPFEVGSSVTFAAATGEFYLGINDNYIPDNLDDWTAVVTVYPASQLVLGCQPPPSLTTLTAGVPYTATCTAYGGTPQYTWAPPVGMPNGLTQTVVSNSSVTISGTPAAGGPYNYTVGVSDNSTPVQSQTLNYQGTIGTLSISCTTTTGVPIPDYPNTGPAQVNVPYSATCTASGGTPQYTWSFVGGTPPAGVSLSSTTGASVTISGSPTAAAGYSYTVQVQDDSSPAQKASLSYAGNVGDLSVTCTTASGPAQVGVSYSATCTAANSAEDYNSYNWSIAPGGSLPLGLSLNPPTTGASVTISGMPSAAGQYNYTVQVTDSDNPTEIVVQNYSGNIATLSPVPTPQALSFNYQLLGAQPASQPLAIASSITGAALMFTATASTANGGNWLSVSPTSGTTPAALMVSVNTAGLAPNTYSGTITVTGAGAGSSPVPVPVTLTVTAAPNLVASPSLLSFSYQQNGTQPASQPLALSSSISGSALTFTAAASTTSGGNWLSVGPTNSTTTPGTLTVSVNTAGLAPNTYSGTIAITSAGGGNSPLAVPVTLTVTPAPVLGASPSPLSFSYQQNGAQPASQPLAVSSSGAALSFTVAASTTSGGNWLSISPTSGATPATPMVSVNAAGLAPNTYSGTITVTAAGAGNSPLAVPVTLIVTQLPNLVPTPSSLSFSYQQNGAQPASQTLALSSSGAALSFTAAASTTSGGNWLSVSPTTLAPTPTTLTVSVNTAGLAPNTYSGTITVTATGAGNSPLAVPVTLTVLPNLTAMPASVTFSYQQGGTQPASQTLVITSSGVALSFTAAATSGGNWLQVGPTSGTTPASLMVSVNTAGLAPNTYSGTITITATGAGNSPLAVPVMLTVTPPPNLVPTPAALNFAYQQNGAPPPAQTLGISSSSSSVTALSFTATPTTSSGGNWLSVGPAGGTTPATLTVSVNTAGLAAGSYSGAVTVSSSGAGNSPLIVPVNVTVPPPATLVVSPLSLTFSYQIGGNPPASQPISVASSTPSTVLSFAVVPAAGCSWLSLNASGAVTPATITAGVNTTGLTATTYSCTFSVTGGSGPAAQVNATLNVTPGAFSVSPASLSFSYQITSTTVQAPPAQNICVTTSQSFTAAVSTTSGWLSVSPSTGCSTPTTFSVSVNPTGLAVGSYNGAVAVSPASGASMQSVFVTLTVTGPTLTHSSLQTFAYVPGGTVPPGQNLTINSSNSQAIMFTASSACPWLTSLPAGSLQTGTPFPLTLNTSALTSGSYSPGTYGCTVTVTSAQASNSPLYVPLTLTVSPANLSVSPGKVSFNVEQDSNTPLLGTVAINAPAPVSFNTSVTGCPSPSWLSVTPATGTTPATLTLQANPANLNASPAPCQVIVTPSQGQQPLSVAVTLTVSKLPTLIVAPSQVYFHFQQNTSVPPLPQVISVLASGNAQIAFSEATGGQSWLHVSPGPGNGNFTVSVDSSLPAGFYYGTVTVNSAQTNPGMQTVPVSVLVDPRPSEGPVLTVAPTSLTFSFSGTGNGNGASQLLRVVNLGGGNPSVTASASTDSGGQWLTVPPSASAAITGASPGSISVTANPAAVIPNASGQVAGTYTGKIVLTAGGLPPLTIPVTMTITPLPVIQLSRTGLSYKAVLGGNEAPAQVVDILDAGSGTLNWSAEAGQFGCADWLTFPGNTSGTVSAGSPAQLLVAFNGTAVEAQPAATYYCSVLISAHDSITGQPAANSPQPVTVVLNLLPAGSYLSPFVQPSGYVFNGAAGSSVPPAEITIVSPTQQAVTYSSAAVTSDGGSWCAVKPDHGPVTAGVPVGITADYTKLSANTSYSCTVQLSFSDGSLQTVSVLAIVIPSGAAAQSSAGQTQPRTSGPRDAQGCSPEPPVFLNPGVGFNATAFQPMEVDIQIQDSCGNPVDTQNVFLFSTYNGNNDPRQDFVGPVQTAPGVYKFQWTPTNMPQNVSQSVVTLTAAYLVSAADLTPISSQLSGTVSLGPNPTRIDAGGVLNAASYTSQMAPGAWIAIYGENLADVPCTGSGILSYQVPLPTGLQGATVLVDNQAVPVLYASCGQINAQIPFNLAINSPHQLTVSLENVPSLPQTITLSEVQPAIFTVPPTGSGQGAIFGPDNVTLADSNNPVSVRDIIVIYCTGLGPVTPNVDAGDLPTGVTAIQAGLAVTIGNVPATNIQYQGLSGGGIGLYQLNVQVPAGVQSGDAVPVVLTVGNLQSQPGVTMAVK